MRDNEKSAPPDAPAEKKPYEPPQLIVYGDIREVTQGVNPAFLIDGVTGAQKTS